MPSRKRTFTPRKAFACTNAHYEFTGYCKPKNDGDMEPVIIVHEADYKKRGTPVAWLRNIDGTGSLHVCAQGDRGAFPVYQ